MSTINSVTAAAYTTTVYESKAAAKKENTEATTEKSYGKDVGVVYEKSSKTVENAGTYKKTSGKTVENAGTYKKTSGKTNTALIEKMKADTANRTNQLRSMVEQMMTKQGKKIGQADDIWSFLASGKYNVSPEVRAQAQKDIADDGYWGVEQTSDRIVEFAKALSGGDSEKADEMIAAFKKGFDQATKAWGKSLPDISSRTYDAVMKKFDAWKNGTETAKTETEE